MQGHRAAVLQHGTVIIEPFAVPVPGVGEVLIATTTSLISPGTERAFFLGLPNTNAPYPLYPGYSNIGRVVAVGTGVSGVGVGDRVATPAAHASHVIVSAARCVPVPPDVPDEVACFFNLIAIAMQGVHKARIELGESVVVIGAGLVGLFALTLARLNGGLPVISVDRDATRLNLARQLAADAAFTADEQLPVLLRDYLHADGAAVVIEATGAGAPILTAFQIAKSRGRVVLLGSARDDVAGVNFYRDVHRKGLTIIGAHEITRPAHESFPGWWTQVEEQRTALKLLALGRLTTDALISHQFTWRDFPAAYELLRSWDTATTGMVIRWE